jgi:hypothetical protein
MPTITRLAGRGGLDRDAAQRAAASRHRAVASCRGLARDDLDHLPLAAFMARTQLPAPSPHILPRRLAQFGEDAAAVQLARDGA